NVDDPSRLAGLVGWLGRLAAAMPVVFPIHPRTRAQLETTGLLAKLAGDPRIRVSEPLGYRAFLGLVDGARLVASDSGGIQEETSVLGVPCITLRTSTERPVTITAGTNVLVGDDLEAAWAAVAAAVAGPGR